MKQFYWLCTVFAVILCYVGYIRSLTHFFRKNLGCGKGEERIFSVLFFCAIVVMEVAAWIWYLPFILMALLRHALFCGMVMLVFKAEKEKKFFGAVVLTVINVLVGNFSASLLSCFVLILKNTVGIGDTAYISLPESYIIGCLSYGAVILLVGWCAGRMAPFFKNKVKKWYILLSIPLLFIILVVDVVNYGASIGIMVVSNVNGREYWNNYYNELFSHIALCILTAVSMCAAGFYVFGMNRIYEEQRKKEQYRAQAAFYQMLEEQYSQMERLRHDIKNHVTGLQGLWKNREWEKMGGYLDRMLQEGALEVEEEATGSRVVDALLYRKRKQAKEENILWECDVQLPKAGAIDEFDLCVLMGNLLDNALEACARLGEKEHKFISVQSDMVKKCLLMEVKNSTGTVSAGEIQSGKADKGGRGESRFTTKENQREHGIGLLNVRETVEKYNGVIEINTQGNIFAVSILLPLETGNGPFVA